MGQKKKNTSMVKIISTITTLQFIKSFFREVILGFFPSRFKAVYACVCVVVFVVICRPHCCKRAHTHTNTHSQPTYAHSRTPAHTTCPLFSRERHGAMERHSSSPSGCVDHQEEMGVLAAATKGHPGHRHSGVGEEKQRGKKR